jgi:hypothetical protein
MTLTLDELVDHIKARYQELDAEYTKHPGSVELRDSEDHGYYAEYYTYKELLEWIEERKKPINE